MLTPKSELFTDVSETMLITLYYRALESKEKNPIIKDERAQEFIERLHFDFSGIKKNDSDVIFTLMRCREFDNYAVEFLKINPTGIVVEIGCGLNDRLGRIDNGKVRWYYMDLPEVMETRTSLIGHDPRSKSISCSVLDSKWIEQVEYNPGDPCLFIAEGVLVYLKEDEVKNIILMLRNNFPGCEFVFDVISPFLNRMHRFKPGQKEVTRLLQWGLKNDADIEKWGSSIKLLSSWRYFDVKEPRLGLTSLMRFIPPLANGARILRYRLG